MHGGDCECCKGVSRSQPPVSVVEAHLQQYYEAVGPLPRYNERPVWKDHSQPQGSQDGDFMQEHQDKVSRHRETVPQALYPITLNTDKYDQWRRPPTPPGFWQIAFPNTQDVEQQNAMADQMMVEREVQVRREVA